MKQDQTASVLRGGSWDLPQDFARSANRDRSYPLNRNNLIGFRVLSRDSATRVLRGGSWDPPQDYTRADYRDGGHPDNQAGSIGFRVLG